MTTASFIFFLNLAAQSPALTTALAKPVSTALPLDLLYITNASGKQVMVLDAEGKEYFRSAIKPVIPFTVGGALGKHSVASVDNNNKRKILLEFEVAASTVIDDGGYYKNMFHLFHGGMFADADAKNGTYPITWNGRAYNVVVPWVLDNFHTAKGIQYFLPNGKELIDIMRQSQREDGMIYSFIQYMPNAHYFLTRDKFSGYSKKIGDKVFVRQPTENHPEYIYVNTIYAVWKSDGDDAWMKQCLASAARALDYSVTDPSRWSQRFGLLKRVYTIDSWDFAVEDEYMPDIGITNSMIIDPVKSKFGVFFGDNTGYLKACNELSEMYRFAGMQVEAGKYSKRSKEISDRLNALAWNGKFFTHFIDEDSTVKRKLGVDEKSQIAQSNAYSLNRDIRPDQKKAIIETYLNLKNNLPIGSPGEWYAIYPPFQKGFGSHNTIWQYMNGGVGGHVPGELALGAFESGYEKYGTDILNRLFELGKKYNNKVWFAYTGSIPPPPPAAVYKPINIAAYTNMDNWDKGANDVFTWMNSKRKGDDLHEMPVGEQTFEGIKFLITDAEKNNRKSVIAVSKQKGFPDHIDIPVNDTAAAVYLLHTSTKPSSEQVAGAVTFMYTDGSSRINYMIMEKHLTYWWFPQLKTDHSGIAWYGKNGVSEGVGVSWCVINNPQPGKVISKIKIQSPEDNGIYTVFGITLANREHFVPVKPTSFGGPDNWAAATAMAGLVEGLAGVKNADGSQAYTTAHVAPRWITTASDSVKVCIRYAASKAYVAYQYYHDKNKKQIKLLLTGNGKKMEAHILLPDAAISVFKNGKPVAFKNTVSPENTKYADINIDNNAPAQLVIHYK